MKNKIYLKEFNSLQELIQKINHIMTPLTFRDELKSILNKDTIKNLSEKYPKCFFPINMGNGAMNLPICNRNGSTDKRMIAFSLKAANRLMKRDDVDRGMLEVTIKKLERLNTTYSKDVPTPANKAAIKANLTKSFIKMKKYLDDIKGR